MPLGNSHRMDYTGLQYKIDELCVDDVYVDGGTATATAGAATLNRSVGKVTSEALTTAAGASYTLTLTNSKIAAADVVLASVNRGAGTTGTPAITRVVPAAGSCVIVVQNIHASEALNAAVVISFVTFKDI